MGSQERSPVGSAVAEQMGWDAGPQASGERLACHFTPPVPSVAPMRHTSAGDPGDVPVEQEEFELGHVIEDARDAIRVEADAKCIRTALALDPHAGLVSGDPGCLEQVVWKLLSNAVRFTPSGGKIDVRLVQQGETMLRLTVRDNGKGFTRDVTPFLFCGVGLGTVKRLVEMHQGSLSGESAGEGRGATFTVFLPRHACEEAQPTSQTSEGRRLDGARILLVDDERDTREILTAVLVLEGARVASAAGTEEALTFLQKWRPDVLVSDIGMAKSDGYDLIHALRGLEKRWGTQIPAAALTGYGTAHDGRMALEAGFQIHVAKPVTPSELVSMVAKLRAQATFST